MEEMNVTLCVVEFFSSILLNMFVRWDTSEAFIPYLKTHPQASRSLYKEVQIQAVLGPPAKLSEAAPSDTIRREKHHGNHHGGHCPKYS